MTKKISLFTGESIVDAKIIDDARADDQRELASARAATGNTSNENATGLEHQKDKEEEELELNEETLQIVGEEPSKSDKELEIHDSLASRWQPWLQEGLKKDIKNALLLKYPRAGNCALESPMLTKNLAH